MEEEIQPCIMGFLSFFVIIALIIFALIAGIKKLVKTIPGLIAALRTFTSRQNPAVVDLHREVGELRRATLQISQNWREMTTLINSIKSQQHTFVQRLDSDFDAMGDCLQGSVKVTLEKECLRNDQRFKEINRMVDGFREDFHVLKKMIQKQSEMLKEGQETRKSSVVVDGWTQTEREEKTMVMKKRPRDGHGKAVDELARENEPSRSSISVIKKALAEFLKEAKKHLTLEREEVMSNMRSMFVRLSEDREEVKTTIESAFSTAAHQTQRSFEQFGAVGRDAMKCISVANDKSQILLTTRFQESGEKIQNIFELLKSLNFDVKSIKETLDNIDGQFDDIYQRVELGSQKNNENCEEIVDNLQETAKDLDQKAVHLNSTGKQLADVAVSIREMLNSLNNKIGDNAGTQLQPYSQVAPNVAGDQSVLEDSYPLSKSITIYGSSSEDYNLLPSIIQTCFVNLNSLKDEIENGTGAIKESVEVLLQKLQYLTEAVESSVESLKNLKGQMPPYERNQKDENFQMELREFVGDILSLDSTIEASSAKKFDKPQDGNAHNLKVNASSDFPNLLGICEANLEPLTGGDIRGISGNTNFFRAMNSAKTVPATIGSADSTPKGTFKKGRGHK